MSEMELVAKIRQYKELQRRIEQAQAEAEEVKELLKAQMGDREELRAGEYRILWKNVASARIDTTALKRELPDVAAMFTRETVSRRFSVA